MVKPVLPAKRPVYCGKEKETMRLPRHQLRLFALPLQLIISFHSLVSSHKKSLKEGILVVLMLIYVLGLWNLQYRWTNNSTSSLGTTLEMTNQWADDDYVDVMKILRHSLQENAKNELTAQATRSNLTTSLPPYSCPSQKYTITQWYGLSDPKHPPPFLRYATYIHGTPPQLLSLSSEPYKVCTSPSLNNRGFMDGTNPSILSVPRLQRELNPKIYPALPWAKENFPSSASEARYFVSTTFKKNHQCPMDQRRSTRQDRRGRQPKEADVLVIDENGQTIWQSHIWEIRTSEHFSADDVRLFLWNREIWISYVRYNVDTGGSRNLINGKAQRINRLVFGYQGWQLIAMVDSAKEIELCCGQNFGALPPLAIDDNVVTDKGHHDSRETLPDLSFLIWPDPVWVSTVSMKRAHYIPEVKLEEPPEQLAKMSFSQFHGTSNQLLYIEEWNEYLGIGHTHRDRKWAGQGKDYSSAKYVRYYTHAFFTIQKVVTETAEEDTSHNHNRFRLARVSSEFLFPSASNPRDADIIQYASGLEWTYNSSLQQEIAITYGVNDCEGYLVRVDWKTVESMLQVVHPGFQVTQVLRGAAEAWK